MEDDVPVWDLDRLKEFVSGAIVRAEGAPPAVAQARQLLGPHAGELAPEVPLGARLTAYHPTHREALTDGWRDALDRPGEVACVDALVCIGDTWHEVQVDFLSLLTDELGVVLVATRLGPEVPEAELPVADEVLPAPGVPASWALLRMAMDGTVLAAEGTVEQVTGLSSDELIGRNIVETIHADDRAAAISLGAIAATTPGVPRAIEHRFVRPDGSIVWVEATLTYDGPTNEMQILLVDVGERRAERAALETSRGEIQELAEEFRLLAEEVPTGAFRTDPSGRVLFANGRFRSLAGGRDIDHLHELAAPPDAWIVEDALTRVLAQADDPDHQRDSVQVELLGRSDGRPLSLRLTAVPGGGPRRGVIGILIDAGPTVELRARARTDSLTGLLNRKALSEHLDAALRNGSEVAVMFVDFDGFKEVNDRHGHHAGDEVLQVVARRLRNAVRGSEEVGRYGGDEFVVVCSEVTAATVSSLHERVEAVLGEPVHFDDTIWKPEASIGLAYTEDGDTAASLLRRADTDMYRVKRAKRALRDPDASAEDTPGEATGS
jgi:diguanylate cyclase (GGDEF)-like protein/PAS domain S-box-containing protein